MERDHIEAY